MHRNGDKTTKNRRSKDAVVNRLEEGSWVAEFNMRRRP